MNVIIDVETFYSIKEGISVSTQGLANYVRDSYAYMLSIVCFEDVEKFHKSGNPDFAWVGTLEELENVELPFDLETAQPWAANSNFDQAWWEKYLPAFTKPWECVLDLGRHYQLPNHLAGLSHAVLEQKLVDKKLRTEMDGVHYRDLPIEKQRDMLNYCLTDSLVEARTMAKLIHDAPPGSIYGMSPVEHEIAMYTRMTNRRGIRIDTARLLKDIQTLELALFAAIKRIPWSEAQDKKGKPVKILSMAQLHAWCHAHEIPPPESRAKGDDELEGLMSGHPRLAEVIGHMRRVNSVNQLIKKAREVEARTDENGIMPLELAYCGAPHTRRWSSRGVNVQNLHQFPVPLTDEEAVELEAARAKYGDQAWQYFVDETGDTKGVWSRRWLIPRPGKKFCILDYAQIEPRCLAWLTDNQAMLESIRAGFNIYEAHARATMGWTGGVLKKENPKKYKLAKIRVLQLGYGSGAGKFLLAARKEGLYEVFEIEAREIMALADAQNILDVQEESSVTTTAQIRKLGFNPKTMKPMTLEEIIEGLASANVQDYRKSNPGIVGLWRTLDEALECALRAPGEHHLDLEMPSGEPLRHWYCRRMPKTVADEETGKKITTWSWMTLAAKNEPRSASYKVWGGFLTENITQRMARDVLAPKVLELEAAGIPVIFSSHDEIIAEVDEDIAEAELERAKTIMRKAPPWAPDLPLEVDGGLFNHYCK